MNPDYVRGAAWVFLFEAALARNSLATPALPCPEPLAVWESLGKPSGLPGIFGMGERYLELRCWRQAEGYFLRLLRTDSNDWESRVRLARTYAGWGKETDVNRQIILLRRMTSAGRAWKSSFTLDRFTHAGMSVEAIERTLPEYPLVRSIRFLVTEEKTGKIRLVVRMTLRERRVESGRERPAAYELSAWWQGRRRMYEIQNGMHQYSAMKGKLGRILDGMGRTWLNP